MFRPKRKEELDSLDSRLPLTYNPAGYRPASQTLSPTAESFVPDFSRHSAVSSLDLSDVSVQTSSTIQDNLDAEGSSASSALARYQEAAIDDTKAIATRYEEMVNDLVDKLPDADPKQKVVTSILERNALSRVSNPMITASSHSSSKKFVADNVALAAGFKRQVEQLRHLGCTESTFLPKNLHDYAEQKQWNEERKRDALQGVLGQMVAKNDMKKKRQQGRIISEIINDIWHFRDETFVEIEIGPCMGSKIAKNGFQYGSERSPVLSLKSVWGSSYDTNNRSGGWPSMAELKADGDLRVWERGNIRAGRISGPVHRRLPKPKLSQTANSRMKSVQVSVTPATSNVFLGQSIDSILAGDMRQQPEPFAEAPKAELTPLMVNVVHRDKEMGMIAESVTRDAQISSPPLVRYYQDHQQVPLELVASGPLEATSMEVGPCLVESAMGMKDIGDPVESAAAMEVVESPIKSTIDMEVAIGTKESATEIEVSSSPTKLAIEMVVAGSSKEFPIDLEATGDSIEATLLMEIAEGSTKSAIEMKAISSTEPTVEMEVAGSSKEFPIDLEATGDSIKSALLVEIAEGSMDEDVASNPTKLEPDQDDEHSSSGFAWSTPEISTPEEVSNAASMISANHGPVVEQALALYDSSCEDHVIEISPFNSDQACSDISFENVEGGGTCNNGAALTAVPVLTLVPIRTIEPIVLSDSSEEDSEEEPEEEVEDDMDDDASVRTVDTIEYEPHEICEGFREEWAAGHSSLFVSR